VTDAEEDVVSGEVETYYEDGSWRNWADGADLGTVHQHRDEAVAEGRAQAAERGVEHIVRDEQATVVERDDA
jgi:hypothetical protein